MASLRAAGVTVHIPEERVEEVRQAIAEALTSGTYRWIRAASSVGGFDDEPEQLLWIDMLVGPGIATMISTERAEKVGPAEAVSFPEL